MKECRSKAIKAPSRDGKRTHAMQSGFTQVQMLKVVFIISWKALFVYFDRLNEENETMSIKACQVLKRCRAEEKKEKKGRPLQEQLV